MVPALTLVGLAAVAGFLGGVSTGRPRLSRGAVADAQPITDPNDPDIRTLVRLQEQLAAALAPLDSITLDSLIADDYRGINAGDLVLDKPVARSVLRSTAGTLVHVVDDSILVRRYDSVAIMTLRETVTARVGDTTGLGRLRITEVWLKRRGRWRAVASHATVIPSGPAS